MKKIKNIIAYIQGNVRYKLYYNEFCWLIPGYIRRQILTRIYSMKQECFIQGSCTECGCRTTHLQMANKACEGNCYPIMLNRSKFEYIEKGNILAIKDKFWKLEEGKFKEVVK